MLNGAIKLHRLRCSILLIFVLSLFTNSQGLVAVAQETAVPVIVRITSFYPNPPGKTELEEWIELTNQGNGSVDLDGWQLDDGIEGSKPYLIEGVNLAGGMRERFGRVATGIILNNDQDNVRLISPSGEVVQQVDYQQAPEGKVAVAQDNEVIWQDDVVSPPLAEGDNGEDSEASATDDDLALSGQIRLSELLADPVGTDSEGEFVELYSAGLGQPLSGWALVVVATRTYHYELTGEIGTGQYLVIGRQDSGLVLNNTGATVQLLRQGEVVDEFTYDETKEGVSWSWLDGTWQQGEPTEGVANRLLAPVMPTSGGSSSARLFFATAQQGTNGSNKTNVSTKEPTQSIWAGLVFSELLIDPVGRDDLGEWLEIKNTSGKTLNLAGLSVRVGQEVVEPAKLYRFPAYWLSSSERFVVKQPDLGQELPNNGGPISLLDPQGKTIVWLRYPKVAEPGASWALKEEGVENLVNRNGQQYQEYFAWTTMLTPGTDNTWPADLPPVMRLAIPSQAYVGVKTWLDASASFDPEGEKLQFSWDFADDSPAGNGGRVGHVYQAAGSYPVLVKISDGQQEVRAERTVAVGPPPALSEGQLQLSGLEPRPLSDLPAWVTMANPSDTMVDLLGVSLVANDKVLWQAATSYLLFPEEEVILLTPEAVPPVVSRLDSGLKLLTLPEAKPGQTMTLELKGPDQIVLSRVVYQDPPPNRALVSIKQDWYWVFPPLPSQLATGREWVEVAKIDQQGSILPPLTPLTALAGLPAGSRVRIQAPVAVGPGVFSRDTFYVAGSGLKVKGANGQVLPTLAPGQLVELYGELKENAQGRWLAMVPTSDALNIVANQMSLKPIHLTPEQISVNHLDQLITITGEVTETSGSTFFLDGQRVDITPSTGIKKPPMRRGDYFRITGILTQGTDNFRLLPRFQADIIKLDAIATTAVSTRSPGTANLASPNVSPTASLAKLALAATPMPTAKNRFPWSTVLFGFFLLVIVTSLVRYWFKT